MYVPVIQEKLSEIVSDKYRLIEYYDRICECIRNRNDRCQVQAFREEELKHVNMIKSIYARILGGEVLGSFHQKHKKEAFSRYIEKIIFLETETIKMTRGLFLSVSDTRIKNGLYYILTDDQRHADMIIFFYIKYS